MHNTVTDSWYTRLLIFKTEILALTQFSFGASGSRWQTGHVVFLFVLHYYDKLVICFSFLSQISRHDINHILTQNL